MSPHRGFRAIGEYASQASLSSRPAEDCPRPLAMSRPEFRRPVRAFPRDWGSID